jgi:hypothetical protein
MIKEIDNIRYEQLNANSYRLEFNEDKQHFHHEKINSFRDQNVYGYITIMSNVSDYDIKLFMIYINLNKRKRYTSIGLKHSAAKFETFLKNLIKNNLMIYPTKI